MSPRSHYRCLLISIGDLFNGEAAVTLETDKGDRLVVSIAESQATFVQARLTAILTPK